MASEPSSAWLDDVGEEVREAVRRGLSASLKLHHDYVGSEHLLIGLCEAPALRTVFDGWLSPAGVRDTVEMIVGKPRRPPDSQPRLTPRARTALRRAHEIAIDHDGPPVMPRHLLLALLELDDDAVASRVLIYARIERADLLARLG